MRYRLKIPKAVRIKLDDYRIIYSIDDDVVTVEVVRVAKRTPKTYRGLI